MVSRDALSTVPGGAGRPPIRRRWIGIGLGLAGWLAYLALSGSPALAEVVAGSGPIPAFRRWLSLGTGVVGISVAELVVVALVLRQVTGAAGGLASVRAGLVSFPRVLGYGALRLGQDLGVLLFLFHALWGFQYARPGLEERLGVAAGGEVSSAELHRLATASVEALNEAYLTLHGVPDAGRPTDAPPIAELVPALEWGWERVVPEFGLPARAAARHGAPKTFLATPVFRSFGVAGMHVPHTGEALVLRNLPGVLRGMDLGHEMAHQRGFAREADANVLGFLVARESEDPFVRYSAQHFLHRQLVGALQRVAAGRAREVTRMRLPGVERDFAAVREFWEPARGVVGQTATRVNDAMLRSHGIPEGVANYQGSVWILVALSREMGDGVLFP